MRCVAQHFCAFVPKRDDAKKSLRVYILALLCLCVGDTLARFRTLGELHHGHEVWGDEPDQTRARRAPNSVRVNVDAFELLVRVLHRRVVLVHRSTKARTQLFDFTELTHVYLLIIRAQCRAFTFKLSEQIRARSRGFRVRRRLGAHSFQRRVHTDARERVIKHSLQSILTACACLANVRVAVRHGW